ncbi:MAG: WG repeat-containing protein [Muribaculaceae bacterium]|nr:WG repeat-containing protein [Muribaculaceae bacterium]
MRKSLILSAAALGLILSSCGSDKVGSVDYIPVKLESSGNWVFMNADGKTLSEEFTKKPSNVINGYFTVMNDNYETSVYKAGDKPELVNTLENLQEAGIFSEGLIPVKRKDAKVYDFADKSGETKWSLGEGMTPDDFFVNGLIVVSNKDNKKGMYNTSGEQVIPFAYDFLSDLYDGVIVARKDNNYVLINKSNEEVAKLSDMNPLTDYQFGFAMAQKGESVGFVDKEGTFTKWSKGDGIKDFNKKYVIYISGSNYGIANLEGEELARAGFDQLSFVTEDTFLAKKGEKWMVVDKEGETINEIDAKHARVVVSPNGSLESDFSIIAGSNGDYALYNKKGEMKDKKKGHFAEY